MGASNSSKAQEQYKTTLVWPEMKETCGGGPSCVNHPREADTIETRFRGFALASAYAACVGRTTKSNAMAKDAVSLRNAVVRGDMDGTRDLMTEMWQSNSNICVNGNKYPVAKDERDQFDGYVRPKHAFVY
jgi:hypothetical protein